jgi:hypothetical protein
VLETGNAAEWLARAAAPGMTVAKLHDLVQACREDPSVPVAAIANRTTVRTFTFDTEQLRTMTLALAKAKTEAETDVDSEALVHMAQDYLGPSSRLVERHLAAIGLVGALSLLERCFPEADLKVEANRPHDDDQED